MSRDDLDPRIERALALLSEAARERLKRHPQGHLVAAGETVELAVPVPLGGEPDRLAGAGAAAAEELAAALDALAHHRSAVRPGRVFCLRCASSECEHSELPSPRDAFVGYGPTGLPRFLDFGQYLLELQHPQVDAVYRGRSPVVTVVAGEDELTASLLDEYRDTARGTRVHGQVAAGWYRLRDERGHEQPLAVTFQVVSSLSRGGRRRLGLNLVALGPDGEPLERLYDRLGGRVPWSGAARWGQEVAQSIEHTLGRGRRRGGGKGKGERKAGGAAADADGALPARAARRVEGLLTGLARRLGKDHRARERRTRHAEDRHDQGDRPTRMALADLARAKDDEVLEDPRRRTLVVLGERGRAHVFNRTGKIVTSIRYSPAAIERRLERGHWRPAPREAVASLRERIGGASPGAGETAEAAGGRAG